LLINVIKQGKNVPIEKIVEKIDDEHPSVVIATMDAIGIALENGIEVPLEKVAGKLNAMQPIDVDWENDRLCKDPLLGRYEAEDDVTCEVRMRAITVLGYAVTVGKKISLDIVLNKLDNQHWQVQEATLIVLKTIVGKGLQPIPIDKIIEKLESKFWQVRLAALEVIGTALEKGRHIPIEIVEKRLEDQDFYVRTMAGDILENLGYFENEN